MSLPSSSRLAKPTKEACFDVENYKITPFYFPVCFIASCLAKAMRTHYGNDYSSRDFPDTPAACWALVVSAQVRRMYTRFSPFFFSLLWG